MLEDYMICGEVVSCSKVVHYVSCGVYKGRIDSVSMADGVWSTDCESYVTMKHCSKEVSIKLTMEFAGENPCEIFYFGRDRVYDTVGKQDTR